MNNIKHTLPKTLILVALFALSTSGISYAQEFNTLYWMKGIPQSSYSNPAMQPLANYYVGFPAFSSLYSGFANTGFAPSDVFGKDINGSLFIDDKKLLANLLPNNYLNVNAANDWLAFGFRVRKKNYFSFNIRERVETRFGYTKDLMRLAIEGNDPFLQEGIAASPNAISLDYNHYREFGIGYSRNWNEKLTIGARMKVLQGMSNINFERSNLDLFTSPNNYELTLSADMLVNTSLPFQLAPLENLDSTEFTFNQDDAIQYATNFGNMGIAMDLGAVYNLTERFSVAVSAKDLGYINWKSDVENFSAMGDIEFKGLEFDDVFTDDEENNTEEENNDFGAYIDSIIDLLDRQETTNAYTLMMSPKFYVSAAYNLTRMHRFALLGKGDLYNGKLYPSLTVSYNFQPINRFGSSFSYSIIHGSMHNVGFGMHINIFPVQIYMVTDNFFWAMQPHTLQNLNFQIGVNIAAGFGSKRDNSAPRYRW